MIECICLRVGISWMPVCYKLQKRFNTSLVIFLPLQKDFNWGLILSNTVCCLMFVTKLARTSKLQVSNFSTVCDLQRWWICLYFDPRDSLISSSIFRVLLTESVIKSKIFSHNFFADSSDPVAATDNCLMVSTFNKTICSLSSYAKNKRHSSKSVSSEKQVLLTASHHQFGSVM